MKRRHNYHSSPDWSGWLTIIVIIILVVAGYCAYGQIAYGDWTCGFKQCVTVKGGEK